MFKVGDKVICINIDSIIVNFIKKPKVQHLKLNKLYNIVNNNGGNDDIELYELPHLFYYKYRFKTYNEIRKQKIKKIQNKINKC